jgi:hypothetical protein
MSRANWGRVLTALLGIAIVGQIVMLVRPTPPQSLEVARTHLEELVNKLHCIGVDVRVVSQRDDGQWDNAIYLTKTNKGEQELKKVPADPGLLDHWQGTIVVMRLGNHARYDNQLEHWGDACLVNDGFVFFGDRELLKEISRCIEEG